MKKKSIKTIAGYTVFDEDGKFQVDATGCFLIYATETCLMNNPYFRANCKFKDFVQVEIKVKTT